MPKYEVVLLEKSKHTFVITAPSPGKAADKAVQRWETGDPIGHEISILDLDASVHLLDARGSRLLGGKNESPVPSRS